MPLVVPGITSNDKADDKTQEWMSKLAGKKISEEASNETAFCKRDLPEVNRVIAPGQMVTKDYNPDRLNVHLNEDGTVANVTHG